VKTVRPFSELVFLQRLLWRLLTSSTVAFISVSVLFFVLLSLASIRDVDPYYVGRGTGRTALIVIIVGFFYGWNHVEVYRSLVLVLLHQIRYVFRNSLFFRIFLFGTIFYITALCVFIELFQPSPFSFGLDFGGFRWYDLSGTYGYFVKLAVFPPFVLGLGLLAMKYMKPSK